jgi:hypothetical protein
MSYLQLAFVIMAVAVPIMAWIIVAVGDDRPR